MKAICFGFLFAIALSSTDAFARKFAALVMDGDTGEVLHAVNESALVHPASLTKQMTLYILFKHLRAKKIGFSSCFCTSKKATFQIPSRLDLKFREKIRVEDAIKALVIKSANDVAVVVAEGLAGSVSSFANLMNAEARRLGMRNTVFFNASGVPDKRQVTTARDMMVLARALYRDFPEYWHFFKTKSFFYKGRYYETHNRILKSDQSVDGIKTGYINASGFNICTSASRKNKWGKLRRLFLVVMGGETRQKRDRYVHQWLARGFQKVLFQPASKPSVLHKHRKNLHILG